ncbi:MAG: integrin alpha [Mucilaginibacter sp.]
MRYYIYAIIILFFSCKQKSADNNVHANSLTGLSKKTSHTIEGDTIVSDRQIIESDTVNGDTIKILSRVERDTTNDARFIIEGECVDGSITANDTKYAWKGFFEQKGQFYLKDAKVKVKFMPETVSDENTEGNYMVKTDNKDPSILLVANLPDLINGPVKKINFDDQIIPGKPRTFYYNNNQYTFYATGHVPEGQDMSYVKDYNLYITGKAKGYYFKQLLVHNDFYDSGFPTSIDFIGDVDKDGIPDLIINSSNYGEGGWWTLFLSKSAGPKRLLVMVGGYGTAD